MDNPILLILIKTVTFLKKNYITCEVFAIQL